MWYIKYNGILLNHQKERILTIYIDVDRTGGYYAERNKSMRERQLYGFIHTWNIRNTAEDQGEGRKKLNGKEVVREGAKT